MAWASQSDVLGDGVVRTRILHEGECLSHEQVHELWKTQPEFALFYSSTILEAGFKSLCWETPPVTSSTLTEDHEFVVVESPLLEGKGANPGPFREHFESAHAEVVSFPNLGRNGIMIVPVPTPDANYNHLANFLKNASNDVVAEIWRLAAQEISAAIGTEPRWMSTAGLGVSWLHIRIDSRPKYYRHEPYRSLL